MARNVSRNESRKRVAAEPVATDLHVVDEQADERVEIAGVEGQRVARHQLADLLVREQLRDRVDGIVRIVGPDWHRRSIAPREESWLA